MNWVICVLLGELTVSTLALLAIAFSVRRRPQPMVEIRGDHARQVLR